jgi:H+-translocating NAD(P) transhydrogenase subunit alpha
MLIGVLSEAGPGERRVALTPEAVAGLKAARPPGPGRPAPADQPAAEQPGAEPDAVEVVVQSGAGTHIHASDEDYTAAGARIAASAQEIAAQADLLAVVGWPERQALGALREGAAIVGLLDPYQQADAIFAVRDSGVTAYALELVPRISRAQSLDALSSQALVSGYRAALVGAQLLPKFFPLFMTAAGTIPPARVLVLGAGVAGLQAIATARRLGAVVHAYDVRSAAADEVRSLGASFVDLGLETREGTGGYAAAQTADFATRQHEALAPHVADADVVITTAAIPGRTAPLLITAQMAAGMRPGSVIVDLAAQSGGNCELSKPGTTEVHGGVTVWGGADVPSQLPVHASKLYAANVTAFTALLRAGDMDDEVLVGCRVTAGGRIAHDGVRNVLEKSDS